MFAIPRNNCSPSPESARRGPGDWKSLIEKPQKYWKTGQAPRALAYCWQEARGFPSCVKHVFERSTIRLFHNIKFILAIPEYKVPLPPKGSYPSQNDIFVLARSDKELITIMVDGKASEPFGKTVAGWRKDHSSEKHKRLIFLCNGLQLKHRNVEHIRYQLLHRTVSVLTEAEKFNAKNALLLIHSFSQAMYGSRNFKSF